MSTIIDPVGPHEPRVYWRRRLVALVVLLVAVFVLFRACSGGGGDDEPTASSSPEATATEQSSDEADADETSTASATSSATASGEVKACRDDQIDVTTTTTRTEYPVGSSVDIRYVVSTKDGVTCKRDVGAAANEVKVVQGDEVVWSSDYCSPSDAKDVRTLGPNAAYSVTVQWDGTETPPECPSGRSDAPAADYEVQGRNGDVTGSGKIITLT